MPKSYALTCHATTPADPVEAVAVRVERKPAQLALTYSIDGNLDQVRIPEPAALRMGSLLWQHTCLEAFIRAEGTTPYHELNLSPSRAWTAHAFRGYRDGGPLNDPSLAPTIDVRRIPHRLELDTVIALDRLSATYEKTALLLGLAAVIELDDGRLTYWSLHHAPGQPDFHHASAFTVRLEPPVE